MDMCAVSFITYCVISQFTAHSMDNVKLSPASPCDTADPSVDVM